MNSNSSQSHSQFYSSEPVAASVSASASAGSSSGLGSSSSAKTPSKRLPLTTAAALARENTMKGIQQKILELIGSLARGEVPYFEHVRKITTGSYKKSHIVPAPGEDNAVRVKKGRGYPSNVTRVSFGISTSQRKFALMVHLMSKVYGMLQEGAAVTTKRDLYYSDVAFYGTQVRLDNGLEDLSLILGVPREGLCVEATAKGLIAGSLLFTDPHGQRIDVGEHRSGLVIPAFVEGLSEFQSNAQFILVVEKDAIFQRLIGEDVFLSLGPFIMITGKGYPDLATRKMIRKLSLGLNLKVFAVVDCDPHGIEIAAIIRWGSYRQATLERCLNSVSDLIVPDLIWIGLLPTDATALGPQLNSSIEMSERDVNKLGSLQTRLLEHGDAFWQDEVRHLQQTKRKVELEAMFLAPKYFSGVFLKTKIQLFLQCST